MGTKAFGRKTITVNYIAILDLQLSKKCVAAVERRNCAPGGPEKSEEKLHVYNEMHIDPYFHKVETSAADKVSSIMKIINYKNDFVLALIESNLYQIKVHVQ